MFINTFTFDYIKELFKSFNVFKIFYYLPLSFYMIQKNYLVYLFLLINDEGKLILKIVEYIKELINSLVHQQFFKINFFSSFIL